MKIQPALPPIPVSTKIPTRLDGLQVPQDDFKSSAPSVWPRALGAATAASLGVMGGQAVMGSLGSALAEAGASSFLVTHGAMLGALVGGVDWRWLEPRASWPRRPAL